MSCWLKLTGFLLLSLATIMLQSCVNAPVESGLQRSQAKGGGMSAQQRGMAAYMRYHDDGTFADVVEARKYLGLAYKTHPQDLGVQKFYYLAEFFYAIETSGSNLSGLTALYSDVNPLVQTQTPPPARISYALVAEPEKNRPVVDGIFRELVKQEPFNAGSWHLMSEYYESQKDAWLATATARRAVELAPDNAEYLYQLGDSINDIIQSTQCRFDQQAYARVAVRHISRAAAKNPNQLYLDNSALQYLRLGLFPLAYAQAQKAWNLEKNWWTATHYTQAALLTDHYDEAEAPITYLRETEQDSAAFIFEAQRQLASGRHAEALAALATLTEQLNAEPEQNTIVYTTRRVQIAWLESLLTKRPVEPNLQEAKMTDDWTQTLVNFVAVPGGRHYLQEQALNGCETTQGLFFQAYVQWRKGDIVGARQDLTQVTASPATLYSEYLWARILLKSPLL